MGRVVVGKLRADGIRVAIVVARFNDFVTQALLRGAEEAWDRHGGDPAALEVAWVPGSFEIPIAAAAFLNVGGYDAVVCLGALIRGATPHFDHLASSVTGALQGLAVQHGVPVINGVLTTDTVEQAIERAGVKAGNKGYDAVVTAVDMVSVLRQIQEGSTG